MSGLNEILRGGGYMIKYYCKHPIQEIRKAVKSVLEHLYLMITGIVTSNDANHYE